MSQSNPSLEIAAACEKLSASASDSPVSGIRNPQLDRWFSDEVHPHGAQLKAYLHRAFPSVTDVDDVVQESYLRIWKAKASAPIQSAKAFLFTIARRLALDLVRHESRSPFVAVKDASQLFVYDPAPDVSQATSTKLEIELLVEAIDSLPARCREIFILCHIEGLQQKEVAVRLGLAEGTVGVQASRGLQRCEEFVRNRLGAEMPGRREQGARGKEQK